MFKSKASILLIASALLMLPGVAAAQPGKGKAPGVTATAASKGGAVTANGLMKRYESLAGSADNVKSLVNGLRAQAEIVLVGESLTPAPPAPPPCSGRFCPPQSTPPGPSEPATITLKFMPATDPMGFGNVDIALALTEADLKAKSVSSPKPEHLKAALMGGTAGGVTFDGVLALRAGGSGWGAIANSLGFELE
jgi:hypothetical protein